MPPRKATSNPAVAKGHRSGLEDGIAALLKARGIDYEYETVVVPYVRRPATYKPDFFLLSNGILIETKGWFLAEDRTKHLLIKEQHPDLDIRFVFANPNNRLGPKSRTTYAAWASKHGFPWAHATVPETWLKEPPAERRLKAALAFRKSSPPKSAADCT